MKLDDVASVKSIRFRKVGPSVSTDAISKAEDIKEQLDEYVSQVYGQPKDDNARNFIKLLYNYHNINRSFYLFFISLWAGTIIFLNRFSFNYIERMSRCNVSALEGHFSFEQILNLTVKNRNDPYDQYCYYDDRNYTAYVLKYNYSYDAIMAAFKKEPVKQTVYCKNNFVTQLAPIEFRKYVVFQTIATRHRKKYPRLIHICYPRYVKQLYHSGSLYCTLFFSLIIGVFGDIYGRKKTFFVTVSVMITAFLMRASTFMPFVLVGNFLRGVQRMCYFTIFLIFVENCSFRFRELFGYCNFQVLFMSKHLDYYNKHMIYYSSVVGIVEFLSICGLGILCFYAPESARWLYFRGSIKKAYQGIGMEVPPNVPVRRREKLTLRSHFRIFTLRLFKKRIALHFLLLVSLSTTCNLNLNYYELNTGINQRELMFLVDSGLYHFIGLLGTQLILYFVEGLTLRVTLFCVATALSGFAFLNNDSSLITQLALFLHLVITTAGMNLVWYQVIKLYPTTNRLTAYGITCTANALSGIVVFNLARFLYDMDKCTQHGPLFISTTLSMAFTWFIAETKGLDLPDTIREALSPFLNLEET